MSKPGRFDQNLGKMAAELEHRRAKPGLRKARAADDSLWPAAPDYVAGVAKTLSRDGDLPETATDDAGERNGRPLR